MTGFGYNINGFGVGGSGGGGIVTLTSQTLINGQSNYLNVTASNFVGAGGTIIIPTDFWVWSNDSTAALIVDVANCTIENNGKIIGKGGDGAAASPTGENGRVAIELNSGVTGVTIINAAGSFIAGGGGGGGRGYDGQGGGGAGGGGTARVRRRGVEGRATRRRRARPGAGRRARGRRGAGRRARRGAGEGGRGLEMGAEAEGGGRARARWGAARWDEGGGASRCARAGGVVRGVGGRQLRQGAGVGRCPRESLCRGDSRGGGGAPGERRGSESRPRGGQLRGAHGFRRPWSELAHSAVPR